MSYASAQCSGDAGVRGCEAGHNHRIRGGAECLEPLEVWVAVINTCHLATDQIVEARNS